MCRVVMAEYLYLFLMKAVAKNLNCLNVSVYFLCGYLWFSNHPLGELLSIPILLAFQSGLFIITEEYYVGEIEDSLCEIKEADLVEIM